jgi:hypothetical protein
MRRQRLAGSARLALENVILKASMPQLKYAKDFGILIFSVSRDEIKTKRQQGKLPAMARDGVL